MSYEGFYEWLCAKGHYTATDAYQDDPEKCPRCSANIVWRHSVDQTNGEIEGDPGTMPYPLEQVGEETGVVTVRTPIYKIPNTGARRLEEGTNPAGSQQPSKLHDVGSNPTERATSCGCVSECRPDLLLPDEYCVNQPTASAGSET